MYEKLKTDIIFYLKEKNSQDLVYFLRYLNSIIQKYALDQRKEITNDIIISIYKSELKKVNEEIEFAIKFNKTELIGKKLKEKEILEIYIPKTLTEQELRIEIERIINEIDIKDLGNIMKAIKNKFGILVDMKISSNIVKELLKMEKK